MLLRDLTYLDPTLLGTVLSVRLILLVCLWLFLSVMTNSFVYAVIYFLTETSLMTKHTTFAFLFTRFRNDVEMNVIDMLA